MPEAPINANQVMLPYRYQDGSGHSEATLLQLFEAIFGSTPGMFLERSTKGWEGIALPHFAVRPLTGGSSLTGGALDAFTPKEGLPIIVTRATLYVITKSTGAATVDIGVGTNSTTVADNLIDGADVGSNSLVAWDNLGAPGTNGKTIQLMSGVQSLTASSVADTTGFVGVLFYEFLRATTTGM